MKKEHTHKKHKEKRRIENVQRRMNFWYFHVSEQKDSFIFALHSSSFVRRFVIFILFSNDFGLLVATSLWWHRQVKQKNELDFLSRHSFINIKKLDTKDYLWITEKNREWKLVQCKEKHQQQMNETKKMAKQIEIF